MNIYEAQQRLIFQLYDVYDHREAANIADMVMEHLTGWKKIDRILNKQVSLLPGKIELLDKYATQLLAHKPVQYVLNEAWFYGLKLFVNQHVLIPRPETEELVEWILHDRKTGTNATSSPDQVVILDIGAGSGCISIALKKNLPHADVFACDISKDALIIAQKNALDNEVDIALLHQDFLNQQQWPHLPYVDVVVSNPPYVPLGDKKTMRPNVLEYEPHLALFVEDDDPLVFYRSISMFATQRLNPNGSIFMEVHEGLAQDVQSLFTANGYSQIEIRKDMQGRDRMIRVTR